MHAGCQICVLNANVADGNRLCKDTYIEAAGTYRRLEAGKRPPAASVADLLSTCTGHKLRLTAINASRRRASNCHATIADTYTDVKHGLLSTKHSGNEWGHRVRARGTECMCERYPSQTQRITHQYGPPAEMRELFSTIMIRTFEAS